MADFMWSDCSYKVFSFLLFFCSVYICISTAYTSRCYCENNLPDCGDSLYHFPHTVYPGETFQVSVVAVGQRDGTVPSRVISIINQEYHPSHLPDSQHLQQASNTHTKLKYTVFSLSQYVVIELRPADSPCSVFADIIATSILVHLHQNCPPGLAFLSQKSHVSVNQDLHTIQTAAV